MAPSKDHRHEAALQAQMDLISNSLSTLISQQLRHLVKGYPMYFYFYSYQHLHRLVEENYRLKEELERTRELNASLKSTCDAQEAELRRSRQEFQRKQDEWRAFKKSLSAKLSSQGSPLQSSKHLEKISQITEIPPPPVSANLQILSEKSNTTHISGTIDTQATLLFPDPEEESDNLGTILPESNTFDGISLLAKLAPDGNSKQTKTSPPLVHSADCECGRKSPIEMRVIHKDVLIFILLGTQEINTWA